MIENWHQSLIPEENLQIFYFHAHYMKRKMYAISNDQRLGDTLTTKWFRYSEFELFCLENWLWTFKGRGGGGIFLKFPKVGGV